MSTSEAQTVTLQASDGEEMVVGKLCPPFLPQK